MVPITGMGLKPRSATSYSDLEQPTSPVSRNGRPHGQTETPDPTFVPVDQCAEEPPLSHEHASPGPPPLRGGAKQRQLRKRGSYRKGRGYGDLSGMDRNWGDLSLVGWGEGTEPALAPSPG